MVVHQTENVVSFLLFTKAKHTIVVQQQQLGHSGVRRRLIMI